MGKPKPAPRYKQNGNTHMTNTPNILFLGAGYTAKCMIRQLRHIDQFAGSRIHGTTRTGQNFQNIKDAGATPVLFEGTGPSETLRRLIKAADFILSSISPKQEGDAVLAHHAADIVANNTLKWLGYLSTVGVYGDHQGAWVNEESQAKPSSERSKWRKQAEDNWLKLHQDHSTPVHIFRLPGIYGPGRGPLNKLKQGRARRIEKKGQVFNRAHVEDIAQTLIQSLRNPNPGSIYNIADDEPAPPQDVLAYGAQLLGIEPPPLIPFNEAEMTTMARSFYTDNKKVSNKRIKEELAIKLKYPTYREGLKACV